VIYFFPDGGSFIHGVLPEALASGEIKLLKSGDFQLRKSEDTKLLITVIKKEVSNH
jgi:hypothetical protein